MMHIEFRNLKYVYHSVCWTITAFLLCYWIYLFYLDDDICLVDYKKYYDKPHHGFPRLSFCLKDPFIEAKLKSDNPKINAESYSDFLMGKNFSPSMLKINYSDVLLDASKYVDKYWIQWRNGSTKIVMVSSEENRLLIPTNSFTWDGVFYHCYTLKDPENKELSAIAISIHNSIFPGGVRTNDARFATLLHTKNQLLTSGTFKYSYPRREINDTYTLRYKVKGVEFIRRRNKKNHPCYEDWTNYDDEILRRHVMRSGCSPLHFRHSYNKSFCLSKDQIASSLFSLRFDDYDIHPPCQGMEKIDYIFEDHIWEEKDIWWNQTRSDGSFWFGLYIYDQKFKEIVQIKAIDINGLIGYIGGYIGLILGYSILQIPECIVMLVQKFKTDCSNCPKSQDNSSPVFVKSIHQRNSHNDHCYEHILTIEKEVQKIHHEISMIKEQQKEMKSGW